MPSTSYEKTDSFTISGTTYSTSSRTTYSSISRTNNTIYVENARVDVKIGGPSGYYFYWNSPIVGSLSFPSGTIRRENTTVKSANSNVYVGDDFSTSSQDFSFTVSKDATTTTTNNGSGLGSANWGNKNTISIPSAGKPSGLYCIPHLESDGFSVSVDYGVSSWGTNCTAGPGRRLEYKLSTSSSYTTRDRVTSANGTVNLSNLTSNARYNFRINVVNGAGHDVDSSASSVTTSPLSCVISGTPTISATSITTSVTQNTGNGYSTIYKYFRIAKGSSAGGTWENISGSSFTVNDLTPNTTYTLQFKSSNQNGIDTVGSTYTFTTLPSVVLIYSDGTIKNAIPYTIKEGGIITMCDFSKIQ